MEKDINSLELMSKEELLEFAKKLVEGGVSLSFYGKRTAQVIERKVMPRIVKVNRSLSFNDDQENSQNIIVDGENLQAMVTLYKYKGQVDLILTDPPYNTGKDFRYNDKWDVDPNDPDLGSIVALDDGSRHTKWMKFMLPRLQVMRNMLKSTGVLAICIDERELFHLGMLLNEVFGEENRIGIINWQKSYSPKNQEKHLSSATEYVLVYAKDKSAAKTGALPRDDAMNQRYTNPDHDKCDWKGADTTASGYRKATVFGIQSPFTGILHYPEDAYEFDGSITYPRKHWACMSKTEIKRELEKTGVKYVEKDLKDNRGKALIIKGSSISLNNYNPEEDPSVHKAREIVEKYCKSGIYPKFFFSRDKSKRFGYGRPFYKTYLDEVQSGKVPITFWADEDYSELFELGNQSWCHTESGHSQTGINELDYIVGKGHGFQTVKPLRLFEKVIQLWCPLSGLVLDPFAGSGTTGHAVLEMNTVSDTKRKFILIEKGEGDDLYAKTLTRTRLVHAITGERVDKSGQVSKLEDPLEGDFSYWELDEKVDAQAILKMRREELIDVIITSHWEDDKRRTTSAITRFDKPYKHLVGKTGLNEGFFIIWNEKDTVGQLNQDTYMEILSEAKDAHVKTPYHVYARFQVYQTPKVRFYQIPDKILMHLGLNENSDRFNNEEDI